MLYKMTSLIAVACLWGSTNPFIKKGSKGIVNVKGSTPVKQFLLELKYLVTNVNYIVPMALNQLGSVLYILTLQTADLSLAVPVANSLTFVFTAIVGLILKEVTPGRNTYVGMLLVLIGTFLCCYDKYKHDVS